VIRWSESARALRPAGRAPGAALASIVLLAALGQAPLRGQTLTTTQISRQLQGELAVDLTVRYAAGTVRLRPADSRTMYALRLSYDPERFEPIHQYQFGRAVLGIESVGSGGVGPLIRRGFPDAEMDLTLTTRVPFDLTMDLGAVQAEIELGGIRLRTLSLQTGASDGELRVSAPNPEEMQWARIRVGAASFHALELGNLNAAEVDVEAGVGDIELDFSGLRRSVTQVHVKLGLGSLEIRVPRDAGIQVTRNSFLTSFNAPGLEARGRELYSPNWTQAERRMIIEVDAAVGSVSILRGGS
jgi:hypothetical protein